MERGAQSPPPVISMHYGTIINQDVVHRFYIVGHLILIVYIIMRFVLMTAHYLFRSLHLILFSI